MICNSKYHGQYLIPTGITWVLRPFRLPYFGLPSARVSCKLLHLTLVSTVLPYCYHLYQPSVTRTATIDRWQNAAVQVPTNVGMMVTINDLEPHWLSPDCNACWARVRSRSRLLWSAVQLHFLRCRLSWTQWARWAYGIGWSARNTIECWCWCNHLHPDQSDHYLVNINLANFLIICLESLFLTENDSLFLPGIRACPSLWGPRPWSWHHQAGFSCQGSQDPYHWRPQAGLNHVNVALFCGAEEATLGLICFVVINPLIFHKYSNFTPPPPFFLFVWSFRLFGSWLVPLRQFFISFVLLPPLPQDFKRNGLTRIHFHSLPFHLLVQVWGWDFAFVAAPFPVLLLRLFLS